ncbi:hypothetical protein [Rhodococcoides yunnanense]|uniref:hypothetical protein n=1 Tax=Rhodococcoides yunnanense TaxID=278209 RepID=UPI000933DF97|nr:hypothetical protein [Rhodococcus yunnanensis]
MTLADACPEVPIEAAVLDTAPVDTASASSSGSASSSLSHGQLDMMRAFFCYEFEVARLDRSSLPEATTEVVAEWVEALEMSGLFVPSELRTMSQAWLSEPDALVSLLVGDVDEIAARRETADAADASSTPSYLRAS